MDPRLAQLRKDNRALMESRVRLPVYETVSVLVHRVPDAVGEAAGKKSNKYKVAKVGQADKVNANDRIYPRREWLVQQDAVNRVKGPAGTFIGAVDHLGCAEGGNLKASPIIWRSLSIDDSGAVTGEFEIVADHSAGKDFQAQIDAGMKVGFSTFGYAHAHRPSAEECELYGLAPYDPDVSDAEYEGPVVIEDWELTKIDSVDNPAVRDARLLDANNTNHKTGAAVPENTQTAAAVNDTPPAENPPMTIKTLDDLKTQLPDVFALHQAELDKLQARVDGLEAVDKKYGAIVKKLGESLTCLAKEHGAEVPLKDGAEVNADLEKQVKDAADALAAAKAEAEKVAGEKAALQAKLDAIEAEKAEAQRKAGVAAKADEKLKDNKFAAAIRKLVDAKLADAAFTAEAVEALVAEKTAEYEAVLGAQPQPQPQPQSQPAPIVTDDEDADDSADDIQGLTSLNDGDEVTDEDGIVIEAKALTCLAD